jgi:hypothetical protein
MTLGAYTTIHIIEVKLVKFVGVKSFEIRVYGPNETPLEISTKNNPKKAYKVKARSEWIRKIEIDLNANEGEVVNHIELSMIGDIKCADEKALFKRLLKTDRVEFLSTTIHPSPITDRSLTSLEILNFIEKQEWPIRLPDPVPEVNYCRGNYIKSNK